MTVGASADGLEGAFLVGGRRRDGAGRRAREDTAQEEEREGDAECREEPQGKERGDLGIVLLVDDLATRDGDKGEQDVDSAARLGASALERERRVRADARAARHDGAGDGAQAFIAALNNVLLRASLLRLVRATVQVLHRVAQLAKVEDGGEDEDALQEDSEPEIGLRMTCSVKQRFSAESNGGPVPRRLQGWIVGQPGSASSMCTRKTPTHLHRRSCGFRGQ